MPRKKPAPAPRAGSTSGATKKAATKKAATKKAAKKAAKTTAKQASKKPAAKRAPRKPKAPDALTIASLNVNGLRSAGRHGFLPWLESARPDLLLLQEVRARPEQVDDDLRSPAGWDSRWVCAEKPGYSGVSTLSRLPVQRHAEGVGLDWADSQARFLRSDFEELTTLNLYLPSGSSSDEAQARKDAFLDHFLAYADALLKEGRPMVLCGDFNIAHTELDIHNPKSNAKNSGFLPHERAWMSELLALGWRDVLREQHPGAAGLYSWWSNRGRAREKDLGWRLDYVLTTPDLAERVVEARIDKHAGLSDHAPVLVSFAR